eukprot:14799395-Alexandrium_andersonii.AAC.1
MTSKMRAVERAEADRVGKREHDQKDVERAGEQDSRRAEGWQSGEATVKQQPEQEQEGQAKQEEQEKQTEQEEDGEDDSSVFSDPEEAAKFDEWL